jgi:ketosteroid isomerase-like protein
MADLPSNPAAFVSHWLDAFNRRDWQAYGDCYTDDVVYMSPGLSEPLHGRAAHVAQDQSGVATVAPEHRPARVGS